MGEHQKSSILSNELVRTLSNVNIERVEHIEVIEIIEKFTQQLKTSGYGINQSRDLVVGGIKCWRNKIKRRERDGRGFYREGKTSLKQRVMQKLLEKETWFKQKKAGAEEGEEYPTVGGGCLFPIPTAVPWLRN